MVKKTEDQKPNKNNNNNSKGNSISDKLLWLSVFLIAAAGIWSNQHYTDVATPIRIAVGIVVLIVMLGLAAVTNSGRSAVSFIGSARKEMRKVVWPNKKEILQTTMVVAIMVVAMALLLWGIDALLLWGVGSFTGKRG